MSGKLVLPVFFAVILVGAMVLGPVIYFAMQAVWPIPFHRAMDRALLISAVAALGLFWARIPLAALWPWDGHAAKRVLLGLVIAAVSMQAIVGLYLAMAGFTSSHLGAGKVAGRVLLAVVAACIAAPLEETIFRGFLQRELARSLGWRAGWIVAALIYMLAHFLKIPATPDKGVAVHLWSGADALAEAFRQMGHSLLVPENLGKAVNLFLIGLILGGVFLRAGNLWVNAGLHGGWILGLLLFNGLTQRDEPPRVAWAGGDILSSVVTTMVLCLVGLWLWRFYRHPSVLPESGPSAP